MNKRQAKARVDAINEGNSSPIKVRWHKIHGSHMQHRQHRPFRRNVKPAKIAEIVKPSKVTV
jgi:hypothetical protein